MITILLSFCGGTIFGFLLAALIGMNRRTEYES